MWTETEQLRQQLELWQMVARCLDAQSGLTNWMNGMTQRATAVLTQCTQTVEGFRAELERVATMAKRLDELEAAMKQPEKENKP